MLLSTTSWLLRTSGRNRTDIQRLTSVSFKICNGIKRRIAPGLHNFNFSFCGVCALWLPFFHVAIGSAALMLIDKASRIAELESQPVPVLVKRAQESKYKIKSNNNAEIFCYSMETWKDMNEPFLNSYVSYLPFLALRFALFDHDINYNNLSCNSLAIYLELSHITWASHYYFEIQDSHLPLSIFLLLTSQTGRLLLCMRSRILYFVNERNRNHN